MHNLTGDLKPLLFINLMTFKNRLKQVVTDPKKAVLGALKWIAYFAIMFWPFILPRFIGNSKGTAAKDAAKFMAIINPYVGGAILLLLLLFVFYTLKKAIDDYHPTIFRAPDANLVFSSPLNRRTVYFFAIVRALWANIMTVLIVIAFFFIITQSFRIHLISANIPIAALGLFSFGLFIQTFRFFIYSLNKKLKSEKLSTIIFYLLMAVCTAVIAWFVLSAKRDVLSMIASLGSPSLEYIPFAGWAKGIICGLLFGNPQLLLFTLLYFVCAVLSLALSIYWADDYYEDTISFLGEKSEIEAAVKTGSADVIMAQSRKGKKSVETEIHFTGSGPKAFMWKSMLLFKKDILSRPVSVISGYILVMAVGIATAFFMNSKDGSDPVFLLLMIAFMISNFLNAMNPVATELKHLYIYMLPGKAWKKLFYTVQVRFLQSAAQMFLMFFPLLVAGKADLGAFAGGFLSALLMNMLAVSGKVIVTAIFRDEKAVRKNPLLAMLMGLFTMLYYLPGLIGGIVCELVYAGITRTQNAPMTPGLLGFSLVSTATVFVMFLISGKLFSRLEYNPDAS